MIDLIFGQNGGKAMLSDSDFSFLPLLLVSSIKDQSKLPKRLLGDGHCLDRVMSSLKPFYFNDFSSKLAKYSMFSGNHFCVKI